jgi:hypothetical protein
MRRSTYGFVLVISVAFTGSYSLCQGAKQSVRNDNSPKLSGNEPDIREILITGDCIAIEDPQKNDNGCHALTCAKFAFEAQKNPNATITIPPPDATVTVAIGLHACLKDMGDNATGVIVGHGAPARINTGSAQSISLGTETDWDDCGNEFHPGPLCSLNKDKISLLTLLGCFTGYTGAEGRNGDAIKLLQDVQKVTAAKTTRAPTGTVFCSDKKFYFLNGADWQNAPSPPAQVAQQPRVLTPQANSFIRVRSVVPNAPPDQKYPKVNLTDQVKVNLTPDLDKIGFLLHPDQQSSLLKFSNLEKPFEFAGCPTSGTQGYIVFNFPPDHDKTVPDKLTLEVLSDGLLRDTSHSAPNVFYQGSPDLAHTFSELLIQLSR